MKFLLDKYDTLFIYMENDEVWPDNEKDALEMSIQKWEGVLKLRPKHCGYSDTCALCQIFQGSYETECIGCPVMKKTGKDNCQDTPFWDAELDRKKNGSMKPRYIKREIKFLKSLRT